MLSGWLKKKSSASLVGRHVWHTRFFVLSAFELEYYKHEKDAKEGKIPTGRIPLKYVKQVAYNSNTNPVRFELVCTGVCFTLQAETLEIAVEWVEKLETVRQEAQKGVKDPEEVGKRFWKVGLEQPAQTEAPPTGKIGRPTFPEFEQLDKPAALATVNWFAYINARYLPFVVRERFHDNPTPIEPGKAEIEYFPGACAFIDISGFTKLSEHLVAKHGARQGAELLNKYISGYFDHLITVVYDFGGDIIKFAGDAMLVLWRNRYEYGKEVRVSGRPPPKQQPTGLSISQLLKKDPAKPSHSEDGRGRRHSLTSSSTRRESPKRPMTAISQDAARVANEKLHPEPPKVSPLPRASGSGPMSPCANSVSLTLATMTGKKKSGDGKHTPRGSTDSTSPRGSTSRSATSSKRDASPPSAKYSQLGDAKHSRDPSHSSNGNDGRTSQSEEMLWETLASEVERGSVTNNHAHAKEKPKHQPKNPQSKLMDLLGTGKDLISSLLLRAIACNLALLQELDNFTPAPGADTLTLHTGVSAGQVVGLFVGGVHQEWLYYIAGDPIDEISECANQAKSGECFLPRKWADEPLIRRHVIAAHVPNSNCIKVTALQSPPNLYNYRRAPIEEKSVAALKMFVPSVILAAADAGASSSMVAEFRTVYVLFVKLDVPSYYDDDVLQFIQRAIFVVQDSVCKFNGSIARLLADDKGTRFKIVFGMPLQAHDDDGPRCVLAALEMQTKLQAMGMASYIGMSTGNVLCCMAGSEKRCEYTAVGYKVIMAARMMSAAAATGDSTIFCDEDVMKNCTKQRASKFRFVPMPSLTMKGIANPVATYTPQYITDKATELSSVKLAKWIRAHKLLGGVGVVPAREDPLDVDKTGRKQRFSVFPRTPFYSFIIGRKSETKELFTRLQNVMNTRKPQIVVIEGEPGMGKSALCYDFVDHVQRECHKVQIAYGVAELSEKEHDYFMFGVLLEQVLRIESITRAPERTAYVKEVLELLFKLKMAEEAAAMPDHLKAPMLEQLRNSYTDELQRRAAPVKDRRQNKPHRRIAPQALDYASLLNPLLNTEFPETEYTKGLDAKGRHSRVEDLVCSLLERPTLAFAVDLSFHAESETPKKSLFGPLRETKPVMKKSFSSSDLAPAVGCLIIEDCHNLDSSSWRMLVRLAERAKQNIMIVITTRSLTGELPEEAAATTAATYASLTDSTDGLKLPGTSPPRTGTLIPSSANNSTSFPIMNRSSSSSRAGLFLHPSSSSPNLSATSLLTKRLGTSANGSSAALLSAVSSVVGSSDDLYASHVQAYKKICKLPHAVFINLKPLTETETYEMADVCFHQSLPEPILKLIWAKTQGHPLYIQEMSRSLLEKKLVEIKNGVVVVDQVALEKASTEGASFMPTDMQGLIVGRIDRLPLDHQLIVKIASVIGNEFKFSLLCKVVPMEGSRDEREKKIKEVCERLVKKGIFLSDSRTRVPDVLDDEEELFKRESSEEEDEPRKAEQQKEDTVYSFVQGYLREAAYAMLPHDQCQGLHDAIAHHYEFEFAKPLHLKNAEGRPFLAPSYSNFCNLIALHYSLGTAQHSAKLTYFYTLAARRAASKEEYKQVLLWYQQVHQTILDHETNVKCFCQMPSPAYQDFRKTDFRLVEAHMGSAWAYVFAGGDNSSAVHPMWTCLEYLSNPLPKVDDLHPSYYTLSLEVLHEGALLNPPPLKPDALMRTFIAFQLLEALVTAYLSEEQLRTPDSDADSEDDLLLEPSRTRHTPSASMVSPFIMPASTSSQAEISAELKARRKQMVWAACRMTSLAASIGNHPLVAICLAYSYCIAESLGWTMVSSMAISQLNVLLKLRMESDDGGTRGRTGSGGDLLSKASQPPPVPQRRISRDDASLRSRPTPPPGLRKTPESPKLAPQERESKVEGKSSPASGMEEEPKKKRRAAAGNTSHPFVSAMSGRTIDEFARYQPPYLQPSGLFLRNDPIARASTSSPVVESVPSPTGEGLAALLAGDGRSARGSQNMGDARLPPPPPPLGRSSTSSETAIIVRAPSGGSTNPSSSSTSASTHTRPSLIVTTAASSTTSVVGTTSSGPTTPKQRSSFVGNTSSSVFVQPITPPPRSASPAPPTTRSSVITSATSFHTSPNTTTSTPATRASVISSTAATVVTVQTGFSVPTTRGSVITSTTTTVSSSTTGCFATRASVITATNTTTTPAPVTPSTRASVITTSATTTTPAQTRPSVITTTTSTTASASTRPSVTTTTTATSPAPSPHTRPSLNILPAGVSFPAPSSPRSNGPTGPSAGPKTTLFINTATVSTTTAAANSGPTKTSTAATTTPHTPTSRPGAPTLAVGSATARSSLSTTSPAAVFGTSKTSTPESKVASPPEGSDSKPPLLRSHSMGDDKTPPDSPSVGPSSPSGRWEPGDPWAAALARNFRPRIEQHADRTAIVLPLLSRPCPAESLADIVLLLTTQTINQRRRALKRCRSDARNAPEVAPEVPSVRPRGQSR